MFALFVVLEGLAILFVLGVLSWTWFISSSRPQPATSGFPVFEAKYRTSVTWNNSPTEKKDPGRIEVSQMIEHMRDAAVFAI